MSLMVSMSWGSKTNRKEEGIMLVVVVDSRSGRDLRMEMVGGGRVE